MVKSCTILRMNDINEKKKLLALYLQFKCTFSRLKIIIEHSTNFFFAYTGCPKKRGTQIKIDITQKLLFIIQFCKNNLFNEHLSMHNPIFDLIPHTLTLQ